MNLFDNRPFFKGNLHTHTTCSDGRKTPEDVFSIYQADGYDFLSITDHWHRTTDCVPYENMLLLPGIEIDYMLKNEVVHVVGINVNEEIAQLKRSSTPQEGIDAICAAGGIAILAHPQWSLNTPQTIQGLKNISAAEIYNTTSGAPWNGDRADSTGLLDIVATAGHLIPCVASDDAHHYNGDECRSFIKVQAESLTAGHLIESIRNGNFYASQGPEFHQINFDGETVTVTCSPVKRVLFHSNLVYSPGRCVSGDQITQAQYVVNHAWGDRYLRIILEDENGCRAWANPFSVEK